MKIFLLQLKRIGDLILTTPAIAAVREKFPHAEITLVVSDATRDLLPAVVGLDHTLLASDWATVARRKFDTSIDFTHSDRSALLTLLAGAQTRVTSGHVKMQSKVRALVYNRFVPSGLRELHTVDHYLALLEPLGIRESSAALTLELPSAALTAADQVLAEHHVTGDFLLLHPGSARSEKFWEAERWSEVIAFATRSGLPCLVTGSPSFIEENHIAQIKATSGASFIDLCGRLDLLTLAALIKKARLLVTVDSAPVHLAAAMHTPQVALFGPTNPLHWRPRFTSALILQAGEVTPLTEFSPDAKGAPMNLISTQQVIDAMKALLAPPRAAPL
ncbi:MAG: glycosyltransferase family 9 protein [Chthoniobacterales bacterium]